MVVLYALPPAWAPAEDQNGAASSNLRDHMRTTAQHRAAVAAWGALAPANDCDILIPTRSSTPRHAALSETLSALLTWRAVSRPAPEPLQSNWRIVPVNDNVPEGCNEDVEEIEPEPVLVDCVHEIRPRVPELLRAVRGVTFAPARESSTDRLPVAGDIEKRDGTIVRLGDVRFGTLPTEEFGSSTLPGNNRHIIAYRGRRPIDRFTSAKGPDLDEDDERCRRERLADWLGCEAGWHIVSSKEGRQAAKEKRARLAGLPNPPLPPTSLDFNEARAFAGLPPATRDERAALPLGSPDIGNIFGSWVSVPKKGKSGSVAQDDAQRFQREEIAARLSDQDVAVLDSAIIGQNFKDVGAVVGASGKAGERRGKSTLIDAVGRLAVILEEMAA